MEEMETTGVTLDTDILIDLLRNVKTTVNFLTEMEVRRTILCTTVINAFELYHGAYRTKEQEKNVLAVGRLLDKLFLLPLSLRSAETAARIYAELEKKDKPTDLRDALIGAVSIANKYPLATRNVEHFRRIPGLTVIPTP